MREATKKRTGRRRLGVVTIFTNFTSNATCGSKYQINNFPYFLWVHWKEYDIQKI